MRPPEGVTTASSASIPTNHRKKRGTARDAIKAILYNEQSAQTVGRTNLGQGTNHKRKPWLTANEQVNHLKTKGVRFDLISEDDAVSYLTKNNNYFRLRSYRTGFPKVVDGKRCGEYVNLDFKMLVDLSIVDMLLRKTLLPLAIDVEHFAKVSLLSAIEDAGEDGYDIVEDFLRANPTVQGDINRGRSSAYIEGLLNRYSRPDFPAWAFMEVISFGSFCHFYQFCAKRFNNTEMQSRYYLLMEVNNFRNACAHNNCILNDLSTQNPPRNRGRVLTQELARIPGIGKSQRRYKMRNRRISQIVTVLFLHSTTASDGVKGYAAKSLAEFVDRMNKNIHYYTGADAVTSTFQFICRVVKFWYPLNENDDGMS